MDVEKTVLSRHSPMFRPWFFYYNGKEYELTKVVLYNEGVIEFENGQGWLCEDNMYAGDVWSLTIPLVKKAIKEDLNRKDCYFIKAKERFMSSAPKYALYINTVAAGIIVTKGKTTKSYKTPTEQGYHTEITIDGLNGQFEKKECTKLVTHIHSHNEPTKEAAQIEDIQKRLRKVFGNTSVSTYDVEKFLKEFKEVK